jgi:hypothetical protein
MESSWSKDNTFFRVPPRGTLLVPPRGTLLVTPGGLGPPSAQQPKLLNRFGQMRRRWNALVRRCSLDIK